MEGRILFAIMLAETALLGGLVLLYPRVVRKGLLFGVYVGEEAFEGSEARRITRSWNRGMAACIVLSLAIGAGFALYFPHPGVAPVPLVLLMIATVVLYLRAYRDARALAPAEAPPPPAVASLATAPPAGRAAPWIAIAAGLLCGCFAILYAGSHYADLPRMVPTHFGASGRPDAFRPKSFFTVMLLPLMVLVFGMGLGGVAWLTSGAKRALRLGDRGLSLSAQLRFRAAVTRYLSLISVLAVSLMTYISVGSVRVGLGLDRRLSPAVMVLGVLVVFVALGGILYIAFHYGQGGARLEKTAKDAPLTDGLADNRRWVLGTFYVNRDDPSMLVERRFGIGYTLNFGNWKAVALFVGFLVFGLGLVLVVILTN